MKGHTRFASNGRDKSRRKSYCHECKYFNRNGSKDIFNTEKLAEKSSIKVRVKTKSRIQFYRISYEEAVEMVKDGVGGIVNSSLIQQLNIKEIVLIRDGYVCRYCRGTGNTIDHIIPKSKGGETTLSNCVCACKKCNLKKGNLSLEEFMVTISKIKRN
ncbi:HNH endonuclease [Neobacillus rhizophilus]|uniref:HNH endonuclease n=1 Tax=Neobacillus rhizophilus TaxID=2833579 RepID=A0A942U9D0_9BACI|nr:HNH endonuclease [Neobacillus rhizophilus]MBS4213234.1 HNH endonuclease [Neobacillus rhizophilus]